MNKFNTYALFLSFYICLVNPAFSQTKSNKIIGRIPITEGEYKPEWSSILKHGIPEWYLDAKFGIWAHWGPQAAPNFGDWYARDMYNPTVSSGGEGLVPDSWEAKRAPTYYQHHVETYGHPSKFGFKDVINTFHAEKWDPEQLLGLYQAAGAKFFVALANHHDNFDNWDSPYQPWNSVNVGPKKDLLAGWEKAAHNHGMKFGVSIHSMSAWGWYTPAFGADASGKFKGVPYDGNMTKADGKGLWWEGLDPADLYTPPHKPGTPPDKTFLDKWYNRHIDLVQRYNIDFVDFDGNLPFGDDIGLNFVANMFNQSKLHNHGVNDAVVTIKEPKVPQRNALIYSIEVGRQDYIDPIPWQCETTLGDWHYRNGQTYSGGAAKIIGTLSDVISKNGVLLLNVSVKGDGSIDEQEVSILKEMAEWMKINGEAIYKSRPWKKYGEGPTHTTAGRFNGDIGGPFTSNDIRFTTRGNTLYAIILGVPKEDIKIASLGSISSVAPSKINTITLLGSSEKITWSQTPGALIIKKNEFSNMKNAIVFKIE